jgi:hypothetical protein
MIVYTIPHRGLGGKVEISFDEFNLVSASDDTVTDGLGGCVMTVLLVGLAYEFF